MMRITNSMMMGNTKSNINGNKVTVDKMNTQMSTQKKITKPSDDPLIAIKSLRLSTTLSQIHQYYDNNMEDAESWMDVTETAMTNMKSIMTDAYRLTVNGATDTLTEQDRNTIYTQLNSLSSQLYAEANADYAGRTVFSGYKTNETVTFNNDVDAAKANYYISEDFSYSDIEKKDYYANKIQTPSANDVTASGGVFGREDPQVVSLNRARLGYDSLTALNMMRMSFDVDTSMNSADATTRGKASIKSSYVSDSTAVNAEQVEQAFTWEVSVKDSKFVYEQSFNKNVIPGTLNADGEWTGTSFTDVNGYTLGIKSEADVNGNIINFDSTKLTRVQRTNSDIYKDADGNVVFTVKNDPTGKVKTIVDTLGNQVEIRLDGANKVSEITDSQKNTINAFSMTIWDSTNNLAVQLNRDTVNTTNSAGNPITNEYLKITTGDKGLDTEMRLETMTEKQFEEHLSKLALGKDAVGGYNATDWENYENTMIFLPDSGEVIIGSTLSDNLTSEHSDLWIGYDKNGFKSGEVRPEMYYNCINKSDASEDNWITYKNFDDDDNWINQKIDYAISSNQYLGVNTQIHDVVNSDTYRDMQEMINTVKQCIDAHTYVDEINKMISSGTYTTEAEKAYLKDALEAAQKQADYYDDNLHNVFSKQLTRFEGYLNQINLAITEIGSRGNQLELAKNRMGNQQTTFKELKSNNEDAELSDITIDYTSAYTAYQASLQAAGKIDDMSLLDYL